MTVSPTVPAPSFILNTEYRLWLSTVALCAQLWSSEMCTVVAMDIPITGDAEGVLRGCDPGHCICVFGRLSVRFVF